ncbi:T9SS type A sorting domain-containing protein [Flavobacterium silvaticum]|uniref:T9SS type A sorting domain-containing protein n=1 Tax=Flavobacterium silvaticum TaxID=1852020 RepID=A0A972FLH8_9FLAO|nr:T9SS type A sorting domain-containing protein [Flavobacterium silvaticum]NMH28201.1 T9SS type A sorting domain-containing protein [Flavobacterium silvaticum]
MKKLYLSLCIMVGGILSAQSLTPQIIQSGGPVCSTGGCTEFTLDYTPAHETTSYTVSSIPYQPAFPFTGGVELDANTDDIWSSQFNIPFSFCFYGQTYASIWVGSNGVVTFTQPSATGPGSCPWNFDWEIPYSEFPIKNAIYGVYQDINTAITTQFGEASNVNYFISGMAPNRAVIINYNQIASFNCDEQLQTSQIVLHETTNEIEVFVLSRTPCTTWNDGFGLIGIQNTSGDSAVVPEGRNSGAWTATNEAWKFSPNGNLLSTVSWSLNGETAASGNPVTLCLDNPENTISATVAYTGCVPVVVSQSINVTLGSFASAAPEDLYHCSDTGTAVFDLTANTANVLAMLDPMEYNVTYFTSLTDAELFANPIVNPSVFMGFGGQVIYASIESLTTGCYAIAGSFTLHVDIPPTAPVGATAQDFTLGQTLADLDVTGIEIQWYADQELTLPISLYTLLEDGVTYYALETYVPPGCIDYTDRAALNLNNVLAVTVHAVLSTSDFDSASVRIYPNPASGIITVSSDRIIDAVSVYSIQGRLLLHKDFHTESAVIDLTGFASGTYLLKVSGQDGTQVAKVVKR